MAKSIDSLGWLNAKAVEARVKRCQDLNLCFISLKPLGERIAQARYSKEVGSISVDSRFLGQPE